MADTIDDKIKQPSGLPNTPSGQGRARVGTGFTNLQRYMGANVGQAGQLGQAVTGGLQRSAANIGQQLGQSKKQFQQAASKGFAPFAGGEQFTQQMITDPLKGQYSAGTQQPQVTTPTAPTPSQTAGGEAPATGVVDPIMPVSPAPTTPVQPLVDPAALERFNLIRAGQYAGPMQLGDTSGLTTGVENLETMARLGQTAPGQQRLLSSFIGRPDYTMGQSQLDAMLMQRAADLSGLRSIAGRSARQLGDVSEYTKSLGQTYAQQAAQQARQLEEQLGTEREKVAGGLQEKLTAAQKREAELAPIIGRTEQALKAGQLSEEDAKALGISTEQLKNLNLYNLDLGKFLKRSDVELPTDVMTTAKMEDITRANALAQLAGLSPTYKDLSKVGTFKESGLGIDMPKLLEAQQQKAAEAADLQKQIRDLSYRRLLQFGGETAGGGVFTGDRDPITGEVTRITGHSGGLYSDVASEQIRDIINRYGSVEAAKQQLGLSSEDTHQFLSNVIQERINKLQALQPERKFKLLEQYNQ